MRSALPPTSGRKHGMQGWPRAPCLAIEQGSGSPEWPEQWPRRWGPPLCTSLTLLATSQRPMWITRLSRFSGEFSSRLEPLERSGWWGRIPSHWALSLLTRASRSPAVTQTREAAMSIRKANAAALSHINIKSPNSQNPLEG